ncbi:glucosyltransferase domain-containing protein [Methyloceanibacter sp.]|uniref:glucosyltransferase domain-containing protein n=1 Tax=Methyloceanibacter sp. TaxID=1965321 RepID=UPI003D6CE88C
MTNESLPRQQIAVEPVIGVAIVMAIFCSLYFHGYEIFQYTLSIDEELMLNKPDLLNYIRRARWGAFVVSWLRTPLPVTHMMTGLVLYGTAFVLLMRRLQVKNWESVIVAAGMFFGFPVLLYAFAFSNLATIVGLGALVSVGALCAANVRTVLRFFLATVLVAFVIALYQSLLYFLLVVFLADLARQIWLAKEFDWNAHWRRFAWYGSIILCGLLLYGLIAFALLKGFGQQLEYLPSYVRSDLLAAYPGAILQRTFEQAWRFYSGAASTFLRFNLAYRLLAALSLAILVWTVAIEWRRTRGGALLWTGLLVAIVAAPFVQHPINNGDMPYRTLIALPAAVAVLALFATEAAGPRLRRWIILPIMAIVMIQFSAINNKQYYAGHWSLERDKVLGTQILSRIAELFPNESTFTIAVVGQGPTKRDTLIPEVPSSTLGASFFRWDGGSRGRVAAFLNFLSNATFNPATDKQMEKAFDDTSAMPSWPERGSIARFDGVVLIKLSEPTPRQIQILCGNRESEFCAKHRP